MLVEPKLQTVLRCVSLFQPTGQTVPWRTIYVSLTELVRLLVLSVTLYLIFCVRVDQTWGWLKTHNFLPHVKISLDKESINGNSSQSLESTRKKVLDSTLLEFVWVLSKVKKNSHSKDIENKSQNFYTSDDSKEPVWLTWVQGVKKCRDEAS